MASRLRILVVLLTLVVPLVLAGQPTPVAAADDIPPVRALNPQPLDAVDDYIITLEFPSLASYSGGIPGLAATSPAVTGARHLDVNSADAQAYLAFLSQRRDEVLQRGGQALGRVLNTGYIYDVVLNGFTARLTASEASLLAQVLGVVHVERNEQRQLLTDRGPRWIGAPAAWGADTSCAPGGNCGEGMIIGVVDSGLNFDHPSFSDTPADGYVYTNPFGPGVYKGWCNSGYAVKVTCNNKVVGAWSFSNSGNNPEDDGGHGSHTTSTAGGNRIANAMYNAPTISIPFDISGVAPHANIIVYDACAPSGCNTTDLVSALQQAVTDGVDAVNYSISGSGQSPWVDSVEKAFLDLRNAGAFVSASAGNDGPGAGTVAHGSPWIMTTAASTHDRALVNAVTGLSSDDNGTLPDIQGRSVTAGYTSHKIVYAGNYNSNNLCQASVWPAGTFHGEIVICDRGVNGRVEKAQNVKDAGGGAMILANAASNGDELIADGYAIPGVHITYSDGVTLKNWVAASTNPLGAIAGTTKDINDLNGDVMAAFSSRGPNMVVPDILKPDMTAPGVDIIAAVASGTGLTAPEYDIYSGTSMSSPHMTGAGTLMMKAKYPGWSVAEIQSALMTTGMWGNSLREEDGVTPTDPFDRGSGRVNLSDALNAGLLLNITGTEYTSANPASGGDPKTLNYPSMADDACYKSCGWTRTVRNPTGQAMNWQGTFIGQNGLLGTLTVPSFTINGGATQQFGVNIPDVSGLTAGNWYFGTVVYHETGNLAPDAHFPVAIKVSGSSDSTMIEKTANPAGTGPNTQITYSVVLKNTVKSSRSFSVTDVVPAGTTYVANSATGGWTYNSGNNTLSGNVSVAAATFVWREKNLSGFDEMAGQVPAANLGSTNLDTGCFSLGTMDYYYLGTHYTDMMISVNGVARAGVPSGFSVPCPSNTPQNIPSPDSNRYHSNDNVLAPFWADLDLTGGSMYLVSTSLNGKAHSVIEWSNAKVKATGQRVSFQLWIEDGTDNIWFSYPTNFNSTVGSATPTATIGAENSDGTEAAKYYYYGGSGSATGKVPDGTVDVWVGLEPATATLGFKTTAGATVPATVVNEASTTVSSTTNKAWASTRICGVATVTSPVISIQAANYTLISWAGSPWDSYQLYRSTSPYVAVGGQGSTLIYSGRNSSFVDAAAPVVGDPATNYFYNLRTMNCSGNSSADSAGVGGFSFALLPGQ